MAQQQIFNGARGQLIINGRIVGLFTQISYGVSYDAIPAHILGRYSPAEITYAGQEAISINASGYRVIDAGPHTVAEVPKLQDLLTHEDISIALYDRKTGKQIMTVVGVRPTGYGTGVAARSISDFSASFLGLRIEDESGTQGESSGASDLTSGI